MPPRLIAPPEAGLFSGTPPVLSEDRHRTTHTARRACLEMCEVPHRLAWGNGATASAIVFQSLGEGLGLAEMIEHLPDFAELAQHRSHVDVDIDRLLHGGLAVRLRVMKAGGTIPQAPNSLGTGRKKRLLPHSNKFECQGETGPVCNGAISLLWAGMEFLLAPCQVYG
jgi:hypothetical protein